MTIRFTDFKAVQSEVNEVLWIYTNSDDLVKGHQMEDKLYEDFISYLANGGSIAIVQKAKEILKVKSLNANKHYG